MVTVDGGILVQEEDKKLIEELKVVTEKKPTEEEMKDLIFGMKVVKYVKSNAIVVAKDGVALGIGGGQVNRIWPTEDALKGGIKAIIQPGGSMRDQESIDACNEYGIAMVFTGLRHFKH